MTNVGLRDIPPMQHAKTLPPAAKALLNSLVAVGNCGIKFCNGESDTSMHVNWNMLSSFFVLNNAAS